MHHGRTSLVIPYMLKTSLSKAQRTRLFIVESMAEIFNKKGYAGTSMADVESITGLSRGTIYHHFDNKESIALAVFDYNFDRLCRLVDEQVELSKSFYEKLVVYAKVYQLIATDGAVSGGSPILNTASEADDTNILLKDRAIKAIKRNEFQISKIIEMGIRTGEFRKNTDAQKIAISILSTLEGGLMIARATNDTERMQCITTSVEALVQSIIN